MKKFLLRTKSILCIVGIIVVVVLSFVLAKKNKDILKLLLALKKSKFDSDNAVVQQKIDANDKQISELSKDTNVSKEKIEELREKNEEMKSNLEKSKTSIDELSKMIDEANKE